MKIEAPAYIYKGKLKIKEPKAFQDSIAHLKDGDGILIYDTDAEKKTKKQRGYYWSTIVPHMLKIMRDEAGYVEWIGKSNEDAHELLKLMFNPKEITLPNGKKKIVPGSTKKMKKEQAKVYIDNIILWAWDTFNYTFPPPKKGQEKYLIE